VGYLNPEELAEIVNEVLSKNGITQADLGERLNLSQATISHMSAGHARDFVKHIDTFFALLAFRYKTNNGELLGSPLVKLLQLVAANDSSAWARATHALQKPHAQTAHSNEKSKDSTGQTGESTRRGATSAIYPYRKKRN
jgi:transcriptional regulator with XRE-family HTH domain